MSIIQWKLFVFLYFLLRRLLLLLLVYYFLSELNKNLHLLLDIGLELVDIFLDALHLLVVNILKPFVCFNLFLHRFLDLRLCCYHLI